MNAEGRAKGSLPSEDLRGCGLTDAGDTEAAEGLS